MPVKEVPELDGEIPENALKERCRALHVALVTLPAASRVTEVEARTYILELYSQPRSQALSSPESSNLVT